MPWKTDVTVNSANNAEILIYEILRKAFRGISKLLQVIKKIYRHISLFSYVNASAISSNICSTHQSIWCCWIVYIFRKTMWMYLAASPVISIYCSFICLLFKGIQFILINILTYTLTIFGYICPFRYETVNISKHRRNSLKYFQFSSNTNRFDF